jgi:putative endonuclease
VIAADTYVKFFQLNTPVRFDIITVTGEKDNFKIEHFKEAFYPPVW